MTSRSESLTDDERLFRAYFWFVGWDCVSLGLHVCPTAPNIEIHIPFGFIRIGWESKPCKALWHKRGFGWLRGGWDGQGYSPITFVMEDET